MAKSKRGGKRKGAGRPATGQDPVRQLRMPTALTDAVTQWAKKQTDKPTLSEAIRRLVTYALQHWR